MRLPLLQRKIRSNRRRSKAGAVITSYATAVPAYLCCAYTAPSNSPALTTREQACAHDYSLADSRAYFINQSLNMRALDGNLRSLG